MRRRLEKIERRAPTQPDAEQPDKIVIVGIDPQTGAQIGPEVTVYER